MTKAGAKPEISYPLIRFRGWVKKGLLRHLNPVERDVLTVYAAHGNPTTGSAWIAARTAQELTGHSRRKDGERRVSERRGEEGVRLA